MNAAPFILPVSPLWSHGTIAGIYTATLQSLSTLSSEQLTPAVFASHRTGASFGQRTGFFKRMMVAGLVAATITVLLSAATVNALQDVTVQVDGEDITLKVRSSYLLRFPS